jgi:hypothetical protein
VNFENPRVTVLPQSVEKHELPCPLWYELQCLFGNRPGEILFRTISRRRQEALAGTGIVAPLTSK